MTAPKITLHWLDNSRAQRILWLLEELELQYEIKQYKRDAKTKLGPPELFAVHPLGKSPVITVEQDGETTTLAESGAIVEFLVERFGGGKLAPSVSGPATARADYLYWVQWAEGTAMLPLMLSLIFSQIPKQVPFFIRPIVNAVGSGVTSQFIRPRLKQNFGFVEATLEKHAFIAGPEFTAADVMVIYPVEGLEIALGYENYPKTQAWRKTVEARPAYQRALEKGGSSNMKVFME